MKHVLTLLPFFIFTAVTSHAAEFWTTDFEAAKKQAAESKKNLLVNFTGSDWCGWCIKLKEEVFNKEEFIQAAQKDYLLVKIDLPRDKSNQSAETQAQNAKLASSYQVQGYPTILLLDAEGRPYAQTGYQKGGPSAYLSHLQEFQKNLEQRNKFFEQAKPLQGLKKAAALAKALKLLPSTFLPHYQSTVDEILVLDPTDSLGFAKQNQELLAQQELEKTVLPLLEAQKFDEAIKISKEIIKTYNLQGEKKQELMAFEVIALANQERFKEALLLLDPIIAIDPESELAKQTPTFRAQLEQAIASKAKTPAEQQETPPAAPENK